MLSIGDKLDDDFADRATVLHGSKRHVAQEACAPRS